MINIRLIFSFLFLLAPICPKAQVLLHYQDNITPDYQELMHMYQWLGSHYANAHLAECGKTDSGKKLHLLVIDKDQKFTPLEARKHGKLVLFINNGIHPGESCGIDASLQFASDLLSGKNGLEKILDNIVVCIVPVYNIDGMLNRGSYNRANQNGPMEAGFRANARNLDLNRDFVKADSRNAGSLIEMFQDWNPDIFVDTHVSDGADYQYTMTLISPFPENLPSALSTYIHTTMLPDLFDQMKNIGFEMIPYVEARGETPESGIEMFPDMPRFGSGYTTLFNSVAFVTETHMLKPYSTQVEATYAFLNVVSQFAATHTLEILQTRETAVRATLEKKQEVLSWEVDTSRYDQILFKGYEAKTKLSEVTGLPRRYFDHNAPWEKPIKYFNHFNPVITTSVPEYYIIPYAWSEVIEKLKNSGVKMRRLSKDTVMEVEVRYIDTYKTIPVPYNGRYLHSEIKTHKTIQKITFHEGDKVIPVRQPALNYIVQTLEPEGPDSFFAWNFFDGILSRKEYFSDYLFEDTAAGLLSKDPELKKQFEEKRSSDSKFAANAYAQLNYIYEHSPWFEITYKRYPVVAIQNRISLPLK